MRLRMGLRVRIATALSLLALCAGVESARAQKPSEVRTAVFYESYSLDESQSYRRVSELTIPVGVRIPLGRVDVVLSSGYVYAEIRSADPTRLRDERLYGFLDTELRVGYSVLPGRLIVFAGGAIPTGIRSVQNQELAILGAISSDVIGFSTSSVGSGGAVSGGFAGAVPVGRFALGVSGSYREPFEYRAVDSDVNDLKPGSEFRLRGGLEGPLGRRTYLRVAGIWAHRTKDAVGGQTLNGVGNRVIGYAALEQGLGSGVLTVYGFDVFRGTPSIEPTALGAALLPRGNLIAAGLRYQVPLGRSTTLVPRGEVRVATAAQSVERSKLLLAGQSYRLGFDLRRQLNDRFALVLQGSGLTGSVVQGGEDVGLQGFRTALHAEWRP